MSDDLPSQEDLLITHILEVIGNCLPCNLEDLSVTDRAVTFTLSHGVSSKQCHVGTVKAQASLTFEELLSKDEEPYNNRYWYDQAKVRTLIKDRFEANLAEKRLKGYRYE